MSTRMVAVARPLASTAHWALKLVMVAVLASTVLPVVPVVVPALLFVPVVPPVAVVESGSALGMRSVPLSPAAPASSPAVSAALSAVSPAVSPLVVSASLPVPVARTGCTKTRAQSNAAIHCFMAICPFEQISLYKIP